MLSTDAPFFIVGNDRSGTTMLRLILDRGEQVAIPTESMFLGDFQPVRRGSLDLTDHDTAVRFARTVWSHPKVALWNLPGEAPVPPKGLAHSDAYKFAVEAPYRSYAQRDGKSRWGDKTPYYLHCIDEILAVWPDAKFIVLIRDGRDVALSIRPLPFGANNSWAAARDWARGIRDGVEASEKHPNNVRFVYYEKLVADPESQVRELCEFLSLNFVSEMLNVEKTASDKLVSSQADWFTNLWAGINQNSVGKWRSKMSPRERKTFVAIAGGELAATGYDTSDLKELPRISLPQVGAYRTHNMAIRLRNFVRLRLIQERGRELRYVLRRKLRRL